MEKLVMDSNFWKNKTILITGHTGFKGSWITLWLKKLGSNVIGFSNNIPTTPSLFKVANIEDEIISITGDITNYDLLKKTLYEHKPEIIIHMAAQSLVRTSYLDPIETYSTNVMGTVNLLEAIKKSNNTKVVINVTSDKCYENLGVDHDFVEDDPMGGYDPYSSSKGCSELITSSFRNSFFNPEKFEEHGLALASVRAGNVIGGGDWSKDRLIPDIIKNINKNSISIRNPNAIRPWQYVLEPLSGYLLLVEKLWSNGKEFSEGWNFGPDHQDSRSVSYVLEQISKILTKKIEWTQDSNNILYESNKLTLNCTKAKNKLKWNPKTNVDQAIRFTLDWYNAYEKGDNMKEFTIKQIKEFELL